MIAFECDIFHMKLNNPISKKKCKLAPVSKWQLEQFAVCLAVENAFATQSIYIAVAEKSIAQPYQTKPKSMQIPRYFG